MERLPAIVHLDDFRRSIVDGDAQLSDMTQRLLLDTLNIAGQQAFEFLARTRPDQPEFEAWIVETAGLPDPDLVSRYNAKMGQGTATAREQSRLAEIEAMDDVLSPAQLSAWEREGFLVVPDAISNKEAGEVAELLWQSIAAEPDDVETWYDADIEGIMIPLFQHASLQYARRSPRIHRAFAQLWGTADLWVTIDRLGFNPPERADYPFSGSGLHWDVSLAQPIPFATQAVLYVTDTSTDQGAFRCVPGFHRHISEWLDSLGGAHPREVDLASEAQTVPGNAGDLVIWRQDLPHGASPNRAGRPRLVQYINYYAPTLETRSEWV